MEPDAQLAPRVLLAVGDPLLRRVASSALRSRGYSVSATTEEEAALTLARSFSPDVVMVDLELHSPEGGNLFDTMRALTDAYIVGIAPPDADTARIRALRAGADDVVAATLNPDELAARCQALLRRPRQLHARWDPMQASVIALGALTVDVGRKEIRVHEIDVPVTRIEFALFEQLCRRPAEVCSRTELLEEVWGYNSGVTTHTLETHVYRLRQKIERDPSNAEILVTESGGYRLVP